MKTVDLFSGCGGMSLGFSNVGFDILAAFDNWEKAVAVYGENFEHPVFCRDLNSDAVLDEILKYSPDVIIGGPPCQDFSSAGKRDISLGRADLTYKFCEIVCRIKPKWFVMENVDRLAKSHIFNEIALELMKNGYGLSACILDSSYCGVPQSRSRLFLIGGFGIRNNVILKILKKNMSKTPMTVKDYLGDSLEIEYYYRHPRNYNRRGIFSINEPSPTIRGVNRPIPKGYKIHDADPPNIDLELIRPLTTKERSYLQTFPKDFILNGTKTDIEQMIGNAVPVKLAEFVANAILEYEKIRSNEKEMKLDSFWSDFIIPKSKLHRQ